MHFKSQWNVVLLRGFVLCLRDGPWPDHTSDPALTREFFDPIFDSKVKIGILGGNFADPELADPSQAAKNDLMRPGSKNFDRAPIISQTTIIAIIIDHSLVFFRLFSSSKIEGAIKDVKWRPFFAVLAVFSHF